MTDKPRKNKGGRPTKYTPELAARVCAYVAQGNPTYKIGEQGDLIAETTLFMWLAKYPQFKEDYVRAREIATEANVSGIRQVVADMRAGVIDHNMARVEIEAIKWEASKRAPKRYGDKVQIDQTVRQRPLQDKTEDELRQMLSEAQGEEQKAVRH